MKVSNKYDVTLNDIIHYVFRPKHIVEQDNVDATTSVATAAAIGFIAGFTGAILLAPESGEELRQQLTDFFEETNTKLANIASDSLHKVLNTIT